MPTRQPSDWRDGKCQTKKSKRPESCASDDRVIRRNAEVCQRIPNDKRERAEAQCEDKPLQDLPSYRFSSSFYRRSSRTLSIAAFNSMTEVSRLTTQELPLYMWLTTNSFCVSRCTIASLSPPAEEKDNSLDAGFVNAVPLWFRSSIELMARDSVGSSSRSMYDTIGSLFAAGVISTRRPPSLWASCP